MKQVLTLLTFAMMSSGLAQAPEYVPADGLVAWYPLDGNGTDVSGNDLHLSENEVTSAVNRLNQPEKALQFNGESSYLLRSSALDLLENSDSFSVQFWAKAGPTSTMEPQCIFYEGFPGEFHFANADPGIDFTSYHWAAKAGGNNWYGPGYGIGTDWFHVVGVQDAGQLTLYINGQVIGSDFSASCCVNAPNDQMVVGARRVTSYIEHPFDGVIDDLGLWNRTLSESEIMGLHSWSPFGCTNAQACNYDPTATIDDGGCVIPPAIELGNDLEVCEESATLDAGPGFDEYSWSTGDTTQSIVISTSDSYSVQALINPVNQMLTLANPGEFKRFTENPFAFGRIKGSISTWMKINEFNADQDSDGSFVMNGYQGTTDLIGLGLHTTAGGPTTNNLRFGFYIDNVWHWAISESVAELDQWYHVVGTWGESGLQIFIDGELSGTGAYSGASPSCEGTLVGGYNGGSLPSSLMDLAIWDDALDVSAIQDIKDCPINASEEGLLGLWSFEDYEGEEIYDSSSSSNHLFNNIEESSPMIESTGFAYSCEVPCLVSQSVDVLFLPRGCTDVEACNYQEEALCDDGTCATCEQLQTACGPGTIWDDESQQCVVADGVCGWNPDADADEMIGVGDLLMFLSVFGSEWPPFECGDDLTYQGYDYETVQIGEQCWFAENSRILPSVSPASEYSLTQPISYVYGYNGNSVEEAKMTSNYSSYGVLYNFQATQQWDLCPSGWHVPSDEDWMELEYSLGLQQDSLSVVGYRGHLVGSSMKSQDLWDGNNQSGLEMLAGGGTVDSGEFVFEGERGWYWTSTEAPAQAAWFRQLETNQSAVYRAHWNQNQQSGHSVRCIQDSE